MNYTSRLTLIDSTDAPIIKIKFNHYYHWINPQDNIKHRMDAYCLITVLSDFINKENFFNSKSVDDLFEVYKTTLNNGIDSFNEKMLLFSSFDKIEHVSERAKEIIPLMLKSLLKMPY